MTRRDQVHNLSSGAITAGGLLFGAVLFCAANWLLAKKGARHRKRCGDCVQQPSEKDKPGSGLAIAMGTMMDALPEGLVIGITVAHQGNPGLATVLGFVFANLPESMSASSGMREAGRSKKFVYALWMGAIALTMVASILGALLLTSAPPEIKGIIEAAAAGLLLAMVVETAIPEAFDHTPDFSGVLVVIGFAILMWTANR